VKSLLLRGMLLAKDRLHFSFVAMDEGSQ